MTHRLARTDRRSYGYEFTCECGQSFTGARTECQSLFAEHSRKKTPTLAELLTECEDGWRVVFRSWRQWHDQLDRRAA